MTDTTNLTVRAVREFERVTAKCVLLGMQSGPGFFTIQQEREREWVESFLRPLAAEIRKRTSEREWRHSTLHPLFEEWARRKRILDLLDRDLFDHMSGWW